MLTFTTHPLFYFQVLIMKMLWMLRNVKITLFVAQIYSKSINIKCVQAFMKGSYFTEHSISGAGKKSF